MYSNFFLKCNSMVGTLVPRWLGYGHVSTLRMDRTHQVFYGTTIYPVSGLALVYGLSYIYCRCELYIHSVAITVVAITVN
jgi:hypothetical protein